MVYIVEAVFTFYRKHLDKLIRENDRMWGGLLPEEVC